MALGLSLGFIVGCSFWAVTEPHVDEPTLPTMGSTAPPRPLSWVTGYRLPLVGETMRPPLKYQGSARAIVEVVDPEKVEGECFAGGPGALACTKMYPGRPTMVMPHPCAFPFDEYAVVLCHELGHVNGWEHRRGL